MISVLNSAAISLQVSGDLPGRWHPAVREYLRSTPALGI
jgi:hypothetical protein